MRYFLDISYVGTRYAGWQIQQNAIGIQQVLNEALSILLKGPTTCYASGRTDAGVHALQQIVQFDGPEEIDAFSWLLKLNSLLPNDIVANALVPVKAEASARFDALSRTYYYKISPKRNPFLIERVLFLFRELDMSKMNEAAALMVKYEDFQSFSKVHTDVNHFRCQIMEAKWEQKEGLFVFTVQANRFLRGMVRTIVGTMLEVGLHKISLDQFEEIILSKDRKKAGQAVAPEGLYLAAIKYPTSVYEIN